jgi:hypothetical protein
MRSPIVVARVPLPLLRRIDAFAQARCLGRAEAVRVLLSNGFEATVPWVAGSDDAPQPEAGSEAA